jgi:excinuclease ABC subunit C
MQKKELGKLKMPDRSGVYMFRGSRREILYVGKATSLRDRVRSYFSSDIVKSRGGRIQKMVGDAKTVTWEETDSVLEALILEANLIKKHQPPANTRDKDNKSFNYLVITDEEYPRVLAVRGRELFQKWDDKDIRHLFGPFPQSLKIALKIVRKIFPYRDKCEPCTTSDVARGATSDVVQCTPCFNRQIGLCPGVCSGDVGKSEYAQTIRNIVLLFSGRKKSLLEKLEKQMAKHAKKEEFEIAAELRRQVHALKHIQDVALIGESYRKSTGGSESSFRIEGYDVAHTSGSNVTGVMTVVVDGEVEKKEYRMFNIRDIANNDIASLKQLLERRLTHPEWQMPRLIVVDGGKAQVNAARKVLDKNGFKIPVVGVVKDERHKPKQILGDKLIGATHEKSILLANSEAHRFSLSKHRRRRSMQML